MGRICPASGAALLSPDANMSLEVKEMLTMTSVWLEAGALKEGGNEKGKKQRKEEILSPKATNLCLPSTILQSLSDITQLHLLSSPRLPMG